jgi:hemoglobin
MTGVAEPLPTEEEIVRLVHEFYARVRKDPKLAPVFEPVLADRWEAHLARMVDFWSSVMLTNGRYKGTPMQAHARHATVTPELFPTWLALFEATARDVLRPELAEAFLARARRIATSLSMGIAISRGEDPLGLRRVDVPIVAA